MKKVLHHFCSVLLLVTMLCGLIFTSTSAYADDREGGNLNTAAVGGGTENCTAPGKLLAKIIPCIVQTFQNASITMLDIFDEVMKPAAMAFMVLVVTLFGVKLLTNEGDFKKDGFILLLKIAFVFMMMDNFGGFVDDLFGSAADLTTIVTSSLSGVLTSYQCDITVYVGESPWKEMDCILGETMGFAPNVVVGSSLLGIMGTAIWSGKLGVTLFMMGISAIFLIFSLVIRSAYTYLTWMLSLAFLVVISPIFIPLILLSFTFEYFEKWMRLVLSAIIGPSIVLAYVAIAFIMLDQVLYDPEIGLMALLPASQVEQMWNGSQQEQSISYLNNPGAFFDKFYGLSEDWMQQSFAFDPANPMLSGAANLTWWNDRYNFDFRGDEATKIDKIFFSLVALVVVAFLLSSMLDSIVQLASQLLGAGFGLSQLVGAKSIVEQKIYDVKDRVQTQWQNSPGMEQSGVAGMQAAVAGVPNALRGARDGFFGRT